MDTNLTTMQTDLDDEGILTITVDVPNESVNVFNQQVIADFDALSGDIDRNDAVKAVIFTSGKATGFIAGADIKMLEQAETQMDGSAISIAAHTMLGRIANNHKPHIAAIHGVCLGAGYELALACHYRIASDDRSTKVGLPEVMLGLLPGGRGNSVLPRLLSLPAALDILLTGKQLNSRRARRLGMVDEVVPNTILMTAAKQQAQQLIAKGIPKRKKPLKHKLLDLPLVKDIIISKVRQQVLQKTRGRYPAPLAILDVVKQGLNKNLEEALAIEAEKFGELTASDEAAQLIHIYFATTELKKARFTQADVKPDTVNKLGILGGGLMGAGIATVSIDKANARVRLKDIRDEGLVSAFEYLDRFYHQRVKRRIVSAEQAQKKRNQVTGSLDYSGFDSCDLIIEAVFEDVNLKHQMVADIENLGNDSTVFASNTSSIPISDIAAKAKRPHNVIGMHYFSPVEKMPLLEIIKHKGTSDQALATAVEFGRQQGKTVIVVNDGAGFYVNRILVPYINAALELGLEGVPFDQIDNALVNFGFPVGPIKLLDEVGLDVGSKIQPVLESAFGERMSGTGVEQKLLDDKRLGKKVKKGFYRYDGSGSSKEKSSKERSSKEIDDSVYTLLNITDSIELPEKTIVERCIYPMLNEAVLCLDHGIIACERDGDIGAIFGIGFPPFLGGPFRYLDSLGINYVVERLAELEKERGKKYQAAPLLLTMDAKKQTFYSDE